MVVAELLFAFVTGLLIAAIRERRALGFGYWV